MNLPNKLTLLRMAAVPLFLGVFYARGLPGNYLWALVLFALAAATDALDGYLARKQGLVTDFGKFMDPLADKLLVMAALLGFVEVGAAPGWVVALILARELAVTGLRTLAAGSGVVIAADGWGKIKTISQMLWILVVLLSLHLGGGGWLAAAARWGMWLVVLTTVGSGANYLFRNRSLLADN